MKPFNKLTAYAAAVRVANVDTDMLIPKQFLKITDRAGLGKFLFNDPRADKNFVLNVPPFDKAGFILAYENFGCGSSREHAVWALADFGIRAVIAPDFADIFFNNASKNGLLLIRLPREKVDALMADNDRQITVNLEAQTVTSANHSFTFDIEPALKQRLLSGLDDIEITLKKSGEIENFERESAQKFPWR